VINHAFAWSSKIKHNLIFKFAEFILRKNRAGASFQHFLLVFQNILNGQKMPISAFSADNFLKGAYNEKMPISASFFGRKCRYFLRDCRRQKDADIGIFCRKKDAGIFCWAIVGAQKMLISAFSTNIGIFYRIVGEA